jgi:hypothetical protein
MQVIIWHVLQVLKFVLLSFKLPWDSKLLPLQFCMCSVVMDHLGFKFRMFPFLIFC